jgi:hypothetical protein
VRGVDPGISERRDHDQESRCSACGGGARAGNPVRSGAAFGQTKGPEHKEAAPAAPPAEADYRVNRVLAPVRDEHHLPGLIGAILTGNRLAAIGALGIRKIGAHEPIRVTD